MPKNATEKWRQAVIASNKSRVWTEEQKVKSRAVLLKYAGWNKGMRIENTIGWGTWKGGTARKYYKKVVLKRDNNTCQICDLYDPEIMTVDHIKPKALFPNLASELTNLMAVCPNCHARKTKKDLLYIRIEKRKRS